MIFCCKICQVEFTTEYLLQKHKNRKIPCNVIFECIRCKKILANQYSLEKHYNKKNPCVEVAKYIKPVQKKTKNKLEEEIILLEKKKEITLEIQKEKNKFKLDMQKAKKLLLEQKKDELEMEVRRETMLEFEREQIKIKKEEEKSKQIELKIQLQEKKEKEKSKQIELKIQLQREKARDNKQYIQMYAENNKKKLERKKEIDLEIIKAKVDSMKTIEVMKNERKEQTSQIINNNVTINIINNCINHIKENHIDKLSIDFSQMQSTAINYLNQNIISKNENVSARFLVDIFEKYDTCNGILKHLLRLAYNNLERDDKRCVWYMKDPEYYFAGTITNNEKNVKLIDFDKHLFPLLKNMLSTTVVKMTSMVTKYVKMGCNYEEGGVSTKYMKHQNLLYYQRNILPFIDECLKDIRKMSDTVFEIESPNF